MFDDIQSAVRSEGPEKAIALLCERLKAEGRFHELFDARLMQARLKHGLPVTQQGSLDDLREPLRSQIEQAYLEACREVGGALLEQGQVRDAWMYLRPVGDNATVAAALEKIEPNDDNVEPLIEVALHEGVSPQFGFQLLLERFGTCNAITTFDSALAVRPLPVRQQAAAMLVRHLHRELMENVRHHIEREEGRPPDGDTLKTIVSGRDWLFAEFSYHIDATHLASVVRAARIGEDADVLRLAIDLTEYGRRLHENFQFRGDAPFVDIYPSHALFFAAQLGQEVDEAVDYFRHRAEEACVEEIGTMPVETYVVLLTRLQRYGEAIDALVRLIPAGVGMQGFAPSLFELCQLAGDYSAMLKRCRERNDAVGFAAAVIRAEEKQG